MNNTDEHCCSSTPIGCISSTTHSPMRNREWFVCSSHRHKNVPLCPNPQEATTTYHFIVATPTTSWLFNAQNKQKLVGTQTIWVLPLSFLFFLSFQPQGPNDRKINAPLCPPLPRVNDWACRHGRVWSVNPVARVRLGWMNVCWYFLMRSLQGSKDGWRSIITYWSPRQIFFSQHSSFFC